MYFNLNLSQSGVAAPATLSAPVAAVLGAVYLDDDLDLVKYIMWRLRLVPI